MASHQPVIDGLTGLYKVLVDLQYLPSNLVTHPPYDGSEETVNQETASDVGFDTEVIELMQKLPYITGDSDDWWVAPNTHPISYLKEWRVEDGRDPLGNGRKDLPPHTVALSWGAPYGIFLIYDTKSGEITEWNPDNESDAAEEASKEPPTGYSHLSSTPAGDLLKTYTSNFKTLKWIPLSTGVIVVEDEDTSVYDELKKAYKDCGWPEKFDIEAFGEKKKQWEEVSLKEYKTQMEEDRKKAMEEPEDEE